MKVLDLFCGLKGFSQAFEERGHDVTTVDILPKFKPTFVADVMNLTPESFNDRCYHFDVVLASPPCNCFSVASIRHHWVDGKPKETAKEAIKLVSHTIDLILNIHPSYWYLENPRGMLRTVLGLPQVTTFFASWGEQRLKPTDIWGRLAPMEWKKPEGWLRTPRGCKYWGTQAVNKKDERGKIPYPLSEAICKACEKALSAQSVPKEQK